MKYVDLPIMFLFCFHFACISACCAGATERIAGRHHVVGNGRQADTNLLLRLLFLYSVLLRKTEYIAIVQERGG